MSDKLLARDQTDTGVAGTDAALTDAAAPSTLPRDDLGTATDGKASLVELTGPAIDFLEKGGLAIWAIAALSVLTLAIILWKLWRLSWLGVWRTSRTEAAVNKWQAYQDRDAIGLVAAGKGLRARLATAAMMCAADPSWSEPDAREEVVRVAKAQLSDARSGLRALELIATIAPLLGLLGTVLGMIAAFQTMQAAGSRPDPSALAGGIWEALLTTAAGMAVAIPASAALTWFESITDRLRHDLEDIATRVFARPDQTVMRHAAE